MRASHKKRAFFMTVRTPNTLNNEDAAHLIFSEVPKREHFGNRDDGNKQRLILPLVCEHERNRCWLGFKTGNENVGIK